MTAYLVIDPDRRVSYACSTPPALVVIGTVEVDAVADGIGMVWTEQFATLWPSDVGGDQDLANLRGTIPTRSTRSKAALGSS